MPKTAEKKVDEAKVDYKPYFIHYLACLSVIPLLILASININKIFTNQKVLGTSIDATAIQEEKKYWQKLVNDNPTYLDAYLQLAKVDVELGNNTEAKTLLEKATSLNPNSSKAEKVQQELGL